MLIKGAGIFFLLAVKVWTQDISGISVLPVNRRNDQIAGGGSALLDVSRSDLNVVSVHAGALGTAYKGRNVCVGIYDSGIDWQHPDFINESGGSRILSLWDQTDTTGSPPQGFTYGTEYTREQINTALQNPGLELVRSRDLWGHGTHVAGIAAGNGRGSGNGQPAGVYTGIAPESDLIIVKGGDRHFIEDWILDGLAYIFGQAEEEGMPAAVNLSVGGIHKGPHDGSSSFERGLDALLWQPGRAIVVAAGNERDDRIHFQGEFSAGSSDTITVSAELPSNTAGADDFAGFDLWYPAFAQLSVSVTTPSGEIFGPVSGSASWESRSGSIYVTITDYGALNKKNMHLWFADTRKGGILIDDLEPGRWQIHLQGNPGRYDGWLYTSSNNAYIESGYTENTLIAEPGNAFLVITVGSYTTRADWPSLFSDPWGLSHLTIGELSSFSSPGPTRDGRTKPEIMAPGEYILSSYSGMTMIDPPTDHWVAKDSLHRAWSGTSMAAPHITGLAALVLEQNPELSASAVKTRLLQNARSDQFTGTIPNNDWGFGKADGLAALGVTYVDSDKPPRTDDWITAFPNPFNSCTTLQVVNDRSAAVHCMLRIFNVRGQTVCILENGPVMPGIHRLHWDGRDIDGSRLVSGCYILQAELGSRKKTVKLLLVE